MMTRRIGNRVACALLIALCFPSFGTDAPKGGTIDWANRGEGPKSLLNGYLPSATVESQGGDSTKVAAWVRGLDDIGEVHGFVVLRHGRLVAEGAWAPYDLKSPHALNGLASVIGAAAVGTDSMERSIRGLPSCEQLIALTATDTEQTLAEAQSVRKLIKDDRMWYEQFVTRHFSAFLGFSWERGFTPGDGVGRKTKVRDLALVGQLMLWKGDWFGRRLVNADWAEKYYRFFIRPSGLRVARGERGQVLAVMPSADLVVAVVADTAKGDHIVSLIEKGLVPAFAVRSNGENPAAASELACLCKTLSLPEVGNLASCGVTLGITYDLPTNRYGYSQFRLSRTKTGGNLELVRPGCAQVISFAAAPKRASGEFVFKDDNGKDPLFANGKYKISATGGWQTPMKCRVRLYLTEAADRYDYEIDLTDADAPLMTVTRGSERGHPLVLKGKRAEQICGVKRIQPRAEIIWTHPIRKAGYIGWPTVMRRKSGELIVSYSGNREAHVCPYGREELIRSFDGGETWTQKPEIFHNSIIDDRDSGIVETKKGSLVSAWFSSTSFWGCYPKAMAKLPKDLVDAARGYWTRRSTDGGKTWEAPVPHRGSAPHGAIQLKDGRLLFVGTAHNRNITWNPKHYPEGNPCMMVEESKDDGRSWQVLSQYVPQKPFFAWEDTFEPYPVETADGRILVFCRSEKSPVMTQVESSDGGRTWGAMSKTSICGLPPHFVTLADGKIVCTYANRKTLHEMAVVSDDNGRTWDVGNGVFISMGPKTDMGYPSTVQNDDGTLLTVYYQPETKNESPCLMATKWRLLK